MIKQDDINRAAWAACDTFRGVVDPSEYKNYVLVTLFLKYMSDVWKEHRETYLKEFDGNEDRVSRKLSRERFILPTVTLKDDKEKEIDSFTADFYSLYERRSASNIGELINITLDHIEEENKSKLGGVFRNIDFNSESALGQTRDRNRRLKNLLEDFAKPELDLSPSRVGSEDIIGNTYQYLIKRFAGDSGKKGGEFYTPEEVSTLLARLIAPQPGNTIADPACGSCSLLIKAGEEVGSNDFALYGQESNGSTWALGRMNCFLHGMDGAQIEWGDTINNPKLLHDDHLRKFDVVVANPPFSLDKWGAEDASTDPHKRFHRGVPPKSKGDYAFISHMIETTVEATGKVGVIVPHGVLFRGAGEGKIRKQLIEENLLDAVIGLPANLFYGTGIPAAILIFNKGKSHTDTLFIDASKEFEKGTNQNKLGAEHMDRVCKTLDDYKTVDKYAYRATLDELKENDFNLNIPRYVDTFEEEEEINIAEVQTEIEDLESKLADVREEMNKHLTELGIENN
jgi:type I restriction enzyme M protein